MSLDVPPNVAQALQKVKQALREIYGDRLHGLYLYGSYARGDASQDSDVDLLVVLDGGVQTGAEICRMNPRMTEICLEHNLLISTLPLARDWFETRTTPFMLNVRAEVVPL